MISRIAEMEVADAFDRGFRAMGRVFMRAGRYVWHRKWGMLGYGFVGWRIVVNFGARGLIFALSIVALAVSTGLLIEARKLNAQTVLVAAEQERDAKRAAAAVQEERNLRVNAENELGLLRLNYAKVMAALAEVQNAPFSRDALAGGLHVVIERLVAAVAGMSDQHRAQAVLDAAEQLRVLCDGLDDDRSAADAAEARVVEVAQRIEGETLELVSKMIANLRAAGIDENALIDSDDL